MLEGQLDGTYQQLEYSPLKVEEAETLVRCQTEWNHLALARGCPKPTGGAGGVGGGVLDGNRTDVEQTANQLESFIPWYGGPSVFVVVSVCPGSAGGGH